MLTRHNKIFPSLSFGLLLLLILRLWSPFVSSLVFFCMSALPLWGLLRCLLSRIVQNYLNYVNSIYLGKNVCLCTTPKYLNWGQEHDLKDIEANQVGEAGDNAFLKSLVILVFWLALITMTVIIIFIQDKPVSLISIDIKGGIVIRVRR